MLHDRWLHDSSQQACWNHLLGFVAQQRVRSTSGTWTPGGPKRFWKAIRVTPSSGLAHYRLPVHSSGKEGAFPFQTFILNVGSCFTLPWGIFGKPKETANVWGLSASVPLLMGAVRVGTCRCVFGTWVKVAAMWWTLCGQAALDSVSAPRWRWARENLCWPSLESRQRRWEPDVL